MTKKRVVLWGTGVVGSMVIAEILDGHPAFELVGVGVSNPAKVGKDAGELLRPRRADRRARDRLRRGADRPEAGRAGPLRADRAVRRREHPGDDRVPARRHRRLLDRDDAVGVAAR